MKMNWGTGIFITIVIFLIGMITLVIISSMQPLNLVSPDYYPKGIDYQKQINRMTRANDLEDDLVIDQDLEYIHIRFPLVDSNSQPQGKILIFFPKDNHLDREFDILVNDSLDQFIPKKALTRSYCRVKISWEQSGLDYYMEKELMIK
jgi:hypothetical protein